MNELSSEFFIILGELSWKMSLLLICKLLRLFANTLTAEDRYFLRNSEVLTQTVEMQLSKKKF